MSEKSTKGRSIPPHANAAAHRTVMEFLNNASASEIAKTAEKVGIYNDRGELTPEYGGNGKARNK